MCIFTNDQRSFGVLQEFQEEIAPIKDDVTHMNQLASTFGPHDIQLSPNNLERIEELNTRWRLLQVHNRAHKHTQTSLSQLKQHFLTTKGDTDLIK